MRRKRRWVKNLTEYAVATLIFVVAFSAAIYVHVNARQWEASAVFASLGLGVVPAIWYFRTKRHGWLAGISSGMLLGFSMGAAMLHGWKDQVIALYLIASVVFMLVVGVVFYRANRRFKSALRMLGQELNDDPSLPRDALFRDDGVRITVYPKRSSLLFQSIYQSCLLAAIVGALLRFRIANLVVVGSLWVLVGLLAPVLLATLFRLVVRRPTLVIGPDGILDHGSLMGTGAGLVRWNEILSVAQTSRPAGWVALRYLGILVADMRTIRQRQPLWKKIPLLFVTATMNSQLQIWQGLLDMPVADLAEQVKRYVETHAPAGWFGPDDEEATATAHHE